MTHAREHCMYMRVIYVLAVRLVAQTHVVQMRNTRRNKDGRERIIHQIAKTRREKEPWLGQRKEPFSFDWTESKWASTCPYSEYPQWYDYCERSLWLGEEWATDWALERPFKVFKNSRTTREVPERITVGCQWTGATPRPNCESCEMAMFINCPEHMPECGGDIFLACDLLLCDKHVFTV